MLADLAERAGRASGGVAPSGVPPRSATPSRAASRPGPRPSMTVRARRASSVSLMSATPTPRLEVTVDRRPDPTARRRARRDPRAPGLRQRFTDHMLLAEWTPERGWHDARVTAVRAARARPGDRRAALRAGDLRGAQGLPARRRVGVDLPARGERRPAGALGAAAGAARAAGRGLRGDRRRPRAGRRALGARPAGEKSLYLRPFMFASEAFLGVRPARHVTYCVIASPAGSVLPRRPRSRSRSGLPSTTPAPRSAAPARPRRGGNYASSLAPQQEAIEPRLRPGRASSTRSSAATSRSSAA